MNRRLTLLGYGIVLLCIVFTAAGCSGAATPTVTPTPAPEGVNVLNPPGEIKDFTLTNQSGEPTSISEFKGKAVLMAFGYTHCPDVCPVTLANFKQVKAALGEKSQQVGFVWISVDGKRDTPQRLTEYLSMFDSTFVGLTGDQEMVRSVISQYGGQFIIEDANGLLKNDYPVQHTASWFLMDPQGRWSRVYSYGTAPKIIAADIEQVLNG